MCKCKECSKKEMELLPEFEGMFGSEFEMEIDPEFGLPPFFGPLIETAANIVSPVLNVAQKAVSPFFNWVTGNITTERKPIFPTTRGGKGGVGLGPFLNLERLEIQHHISKGNRNENNLTDIIFFNRHLELDHKKLTKSMHEFEKLSKEWLEIRNNLVRPLLKSQNEFETIFPEMEFENDSTNPILDLITGKSKTELVNNQFKQNVETTGEWTNASNAGNLALGTIINGNRVKYPISKKNWNENYLTDRIFFLRHPELDYKKLTKSMPEFKKLSNEWLQIRNNVVRPLLINNKEFETIYPEMEFEAMPVNISRTDKSYIKWVQESLNKILGLRLGTDGINGAATRSAIRSFQRQNRMTQDGVVGPKTEAMILKSITTSSPSTFIRPSMVDPKKVSCLSSPYKDAIARRMGVVDPLAAIEAICQRSYTLLDSTIIELKRIKARVTAGASPSAPTISEGLAWSMRTRMLMRVEERATWIGSGTRNAGLIIRWLTNIRDLIGSRDLWFNCLSNDKDCDNAVAFVWGKDSVGHNKHMVHFCLSFWELGGGDERLALDFKVQTLIHELSHIYYDTDDKGMGPGRAECIAQFVADANNIDIRPHAVGRCGAARP